LRPQTLDFMITAGVCTGKPRSRATPDWEPPR
jgi:hypothetical protein